jgi:lipopolysaccharide cholinephosphotransferase
MTNVHLSDADLQRLHQVQLEMLLELDRVCRCLGLTYQLGAGSLLGAVRHGGFIPWDDDVDVVMLRAEYQRFLREAPPLLNQRFFLQTWQSDPHFQSNFAKLRRNDTAFREAFCQHSPQHHGIYIDVFPFDPVWPESWWWRGLLTVVLGLRKGLLLLQSLAIDDPDTLLPPDPHIWRRRLRAWMYRTLSQVPANRWMALQGILLRSLARVPSNQVVCLANGSLRWKRLRALSRPIAEFEQTVRLTFAGQLLPITAFHDRALTRLYGDYRHLPPPERRRPGHPVVEFRLPED